MYSQLNMGCCTYPFKRQIIFFIYCYYYADIQERSQQHMQNLSTISEHSSRCRQKNFVCFTSTYFLLIYFMMQSYEYTHKINHYLQQTSKILPKNTNRYLIYLLYIQMIQIHMGCWTYLFFLHLLVKCCFHGLGVY